MRQKGASLLCLMAAHQSAAWVVPWPRPWRTRTLLNYEEQDHAMDAFSQAMQAYQQQPSLPGTFDTTPPNLQQEQPPDPSFPFQPQQQQQQQPAPNTFASPNNEAPPGQPTFPQQQQQQQFSEPLVTSEPDPAEKARQETAQSNMILGGPPALDFEPVEQTDELNQQQGGYSGRPGENPPGATFESIKVDTGAWDVWNGKDTNVKSEVPTVKKQQQQQQMNAPPPDTMQQQQQQQQDLMWTEGGPGLNQPSAPAEEPKYTGRPGENPPGCTFESIKVDTGAWDVWNGKDTSNMKSQVPTGNYKEREQQQQEQTQTSRPRESQGELYDIRASSKQDFVQSQDATPQDAGPTDFGPLCTFEPISVDTDAWAAWAPVAPAPQQVPPPAPQQQQQSFVPPPAPQQQQMAPGQQVPPPQQQQFQQQQLYEQQQYQQQAAMQQQMRQDQSNEYSAAQEQSSMEMQGVEQQIRQQYHQETQGAAQGAPQMSEEQPGMESEQSQSLVSSEPQESFGQYQPDYGPDCTFEPVGVDIGAWAAWLTPQSQTPPPETKPPARRDAAQTKPAPQQQQSQSSLPTEPKAPISPPPAATKEVKPNIERKVPKPAIKTPETAKQSASEMPKSARFVEIDTKAPIIKASSKIPQQKNGLDEVADMVKDAFMSGNTKPPPDESLEEAIDGRFVFNINTQVGEWVKKPSYPGQDWTAYIDNYGNFNVCYFEDKECPPQQTQKSGPWSQFVTKNGEVYYYNEKTQESQWNPPKGFKVRAKKPIEPPPSTKPPSPVEEPFSKQTSEKQSKLSKSWSLFPRQDSSDEKSTEEKPIVSSSKQEQPKLPAPWKKRENPILSALTANEPDTDWLKPPKTDPLKDTPRSRPQPKKTVVEPKLKQKRVERKVDILEEAKRARMAPPAENKGKTSSTVNLFNRNKTVDDASTLSTSSKSRRCNEAPKPSSPTINLFNWNKTESDSPTLTKNARAEVLARKAALEAKQRAQMKDKGRPSKSLFNFSAEDKPETQKKASPTSKKSPTMSIFGTTLKSDDGKPPPRSSKAVKRKSQAVKRTPTQSIQKDARPTGKSPTRVVRKPPTNEVTPKKKSLAERKADLERRRKEYDKKWNWKL